jgi:NADH:ubiquinone oxidoreductase subunit H
VITTLGQLWSITAHWIAIIFWGIVRLIFWPPIYQFIIIPGLIVALIVVISIIWFERKAAARVQMRYGPWEVSPRLAGYLQLFADLIRYSFQEIIVPRTVDYAPFLLSPLLALLFSLLPLVAMPVSPLDWTWPIPMKYSVLIAAALGTLSPIFIVAMGWASNNRFATIGSMRESFLITAYELSAIISMFSAVAAVHSFNFVDIVAAQGHGKWFGLLNPIALIAALIATAISTSAFPFEISDAENEIVAGPFTEYSGLMYGVNMGTAYIKRWTFSVMITLIFLGGWRPYIPPPHAGYILGYFVPSLIVTAKATIVMGVLSFLRAVYGRYRIDQALHVSWKYVFALAIVGFGLGILEGYLGVY